MLFHHPQQAAIAFYCSSDLLFQMARQGMVAAAFCR